MDRTSKSAESLGRANRRRLMDVLRRDGPTPRVAIARNTGLSFAAISAITSKLISEQLVCEGETDAGPLSGRAEPALPENRRVNWPVEIPDRAPRHLLASSSRDANRRRGRPAVELRLNPDFGRVIAVSLRMNLIETLITDFSGAPLARRSQGLTTRALEPATLCRLVIDRIGAILDKTATPRRRLLGIGLALQGIVNAESGRQLWSPALSITDIEIAEPVRLAFDVPVVIANDAVAVALAIVGREPALARGVSATIMVGHGVGMGVLQDGESTLGHGGGGSEVGHVKLAPDGPQCRCGQRGCIEAYLADYALYRDARTFLDLPPAESQHPSEEQMELLRDRARRGDPRLELMFRQAGRALAQAVAATVSVLRPQHVILAGPGLQAFPMMLQAYEERLEEAVLPWLLKRTAIHVRPSTSTTIVEGMARGTLRVVDRRLLETTASERRRA
jgi:predicted NBD/HSP70 family sugar kinase